MRNFTRKALLSLMLTIFGVTTGFAQGGGSIAPQEITESTSSITLKTIRALFPDQPVAVANELFGGLHSVADVDSLHGKDDALADAELQVGMLVYVKSVDMYYRYKGQDADGKNDLTQTTTVVPDVADANGVNTNYWESLSSVLGDNIHPEVYDDTTGVVNIIEGDIYLNNDTTFIWDGDSWETLADNKAYEESVSYGDTATTATTKEGDIIIDNNGALDTTWVYDGAKWVIASTESPLTQVYADTTGVVDLYEGDVYLPTGNDTTFIWDGDSWEVLSIVEKGVYQVYTDLDGAANGSAPAAWEEAAKDMDAFRTQLADLDASDANRLTGSDGIIIYYPASWGDFIYSVLYGTNKVELANGISVSTLQGDVTVDGTAFTAGIDYKMVTIKSRTRTVVVD